jgi:hypothetical protein
MGTGSERGFGKIRAVKMACVHTPDFIGYHRKHSIALE